MSFQSSFDIAKKAKPISSKVEKLFFDLTTKSGLQPEKANTFQDQNDHIDFYITSRIDGSKLSVDLKGAKKYTDDKLFLMELRNEHGDDGWLFGKADIIAFQYENAFLMVKRDKLLELMNSIMDFYGHSATGHKILKLNPAYQSFERPAVAPHYYIRADHPAEAITYLTGARLKSIVILVLKG